MNRHDSHAQRVLVSKYRRVHSRMRWLNALAERGIRPVHMAASRLRRIARQVREAVATPVRSRGFSFSRVGVGGMEWLEGRAMLSITPSLTGSQVAFTGSDGTDVLELRVNADGFLEYSVGGGSFSNDLNGKLAGAQTLSVSGSTSLAVDLLNGTNTLWVDTSLITALGTTGTLNYAGGTDGDTLAATGFGSNTWRLSSADVGTLDGVVSFSGVDSITGGLGADELVGPAAETAWTISSLFSGQLSGGVSFERIENVTGSDGFKDTFTVSPGGRMVTIKGADADQDSIVFEVDADSDAKIVSMTAGTFTITTLSLLDSLLSQSPPQPEVIALRQGISTWSLKISASSDADHATLAAGPAGQLLLSSSNFSPLPARSFLPVTFDRPTGTLTIDLGDGDDTMDVTAGGLPSGLAVNVLGGLGTNTAHAPNDLSGDPLQWSITGPNAFALDGTSLSFENVQSLVGASGKKDVFKFLPGGGLAGVVTGQQADGDEVVFQLELKTESQSLAMGAASGSGVTTIDGTVVATYAEMASAQNVRIIGTDFDDKVIVGAAATGGGMAISSGAVPVLDYAKQVVLAAPASAVSVVGNQLTFPAGRGFKTGDPVVYDNGGGTNASIGSLESGRTYYLIQLSATAFRLAKTVGDAQTNTAVVLTSTGSGAGHAFVPLIDGDNGFGTITLTRPAGSLAILPGAGSDVVTIYTQALAATTAVRIDDTEGTADAVYVGVGAGNGAVSVDLSGATANNGSIVAAGFTVGYTGIESPQNVIITTTDAAETLTLAASGGRLVLGGTGNGAGTVTTDVPTGSLTIDAAGGSDSLALASGLDLATSLILAGGAGTDAATLDGALTSLAVHADIESVADNSTTATLSFVGTDGDDGIKVTGNGAGHVTIASTGTPATFSLLTFKTPGTLLAIVCAGVLMLRTRQYRTGTEVLVGLVSGLLGLFSVALSLLWLHPDWRPTTAVVLAATGGVLLALTLVPATPSVRRGRVGDIAETVALVSLLPLAVIATGLFSAISG